MASNHGQQSWHAPFGARCRCDQQPINRQQGITSYATSWDGCRALFTAHRAAPVHVERCGSRLAASATLEPLEEPGEIGWSRSRVAVLQIARGACRGDQRGRARWRCVGPRGLSCLSCPPVGARRLASGVGFVVGFLRSVWARRYRAKRPPLRRRRVRHSIAILRTNGLAAIAATLEMRQCDGTRSNRCGATANT